MLLNRFFDIISFGTSPNARYGFIVLTSLISAGVFLFIFKKTSNQRKIRLHKNRILGNILQIPLYKDRFGVLLVSILHIVKHNILYLQQMLIPLVVILIPFALLTVQINNRCGYTPLEVNQRFIIRVGLDANALRDSLISTIERVYCETSPEIILETPPLRVETDGNVFWRARIAERTQQNQPSLRIGIRGNNANVEKILATDYRHKRFSPEKKKWSLWNELFNNAEGFIAPNSPFKSISTNYLRASYPFLFWNVDAIILYFILTLLFAFALKPLFRVSF